MSDETESWDYVQTVQLIAVCALVCERIQRNLRSCSIGREGLKYEPHKAAKKEASNRGWVPPDVENPTE